MTKGSYIASCGEAIRIFITTSGKLIGEIPLQAVAKFLSDNILFLRDDDDNFSVYEISKNLITRKKCFGSVKGFDACLISKNHLFVVSRMKNKGIKMRCYDIQNNRKKFTVSTLGKEPGGRPMFYVAGNKNHRRFIFHWVREIREHKLWNNMGDRYLRLDYSGYAGKIFGRMYNLCVSQQSDLRVEIYKALDQKIILEGNLRKLKHNRIILQNKNHVLQKIEIPCGHIETIQFSSNEEHIFFNRDNAIYKLRIGHEPEKIYTCTSNPVFAIRDM